MAYITGSVSTVSQFVAAIHNAAVSVGWTSLRFTTLEAIIQSPEGDIFALRLAQGGSNDNPVQPSTSIDFGFGFYVYAPTAYAGSQPGYEQPGFTLPFPARGHWWVAESTGPYVSYHIFVSDGYLHAILEYKPKYYSHFHIGRLDKKGLPYDGCQYVQTTSNTSTYGVMRSNGFPWTVYNYSRDLGAQIAAPNFFNVSASGTSAVFGGNNVLFVNDFEGRAGRWAYPPAGHFDPVPSVDSPGFVALGSGYMSALPDVARLLSSHNEMTGETLLVPPKVYMRGAQSRIRFMGEVRDTAYCDMTGLEPAGQIFLGTEEWRVFPLSFFNPNNLDVSESSGSLGIAHKVVL